MICVVNIICRIIFNYKKAAGRAGGRQKKIIEIQSGICG